MVEEGIRHQAAAGVDVRAATAATLAAGGAAASAAPFSARGAPDPPSAGVPPVPPPVPPVPVSSDGATIPRLAQPTQAGTSEGAREDETHEEGVHQRSSEIIVETPQS